MTESYRIIGRDGTTIAEVVPCAAARMFARRDLRQLMGENGTIGDLHLLYGFHQSRIEGLTDETDLLKWAETINDVDPVTGTEERAEGEG